MPIIAGESRAGFWGMSLRWKMFNVWGICCSCCLLALLAVILFTQTELLQSVTTEVKLLLTALTLNWCTELETKILYSQI